MFFLLIPGNHETVATADFLAAVYEPHVKNIHGYAVRYQDVGIFGAGGATNIGPQPPVDEGEMYDLLKKGFDFQFACFIFVFTLSFPTFI